MTTGGQHDAPTGAISVGMAIFQARCAYRFVLDADTPQAGRSRLRATW